MQKYARLWIDYHQKNNNRDCKYLQRIRIPGADEKNDIIRNALWELKEGLKRMLALDPVILPGTFDAPIVTDTDSMRSSETYEISLGEEGLLIRAFGASGVLYAVFEYKSIFGVPCRNIS